MKYFAGLLAILALVAAATVGLYRVWDKATHTRDDNGGVLAGGSAPSATTSDASAPPDGAVTITGTVTAVHLEGAAIGPFATPFTVTTADRGVGGATITPVDVDGTQTSIDWQAGQPLPLAGDGGAVLLDAVSVDATADGISFVLDGVQGMAPATYQISTSVAVGSTPKDSVTFTTTDKTTVQFRGTARVPFSGPLVSTKGTGKVTLEGTMTITRADHSTSTASSLTLDNGAYTITIAPVAGGGYAVSATLPANVH